MTLHLAASYSYDSGIIAYSLLVFACLMRGFFGEQRSIGKREIIIYLIISVLLAPCKVIYSGLILLGLFVPLSQFIDEKTGRFSRFLLMRYAFCIGLTFGIDEQLGFSDFRFLSGP